MLAPCIVKQIFSTMLYVFHWLTGAWASRKIKILLWLQDNKTGTYNGWAVRLLFGPRTKKNFVTTRQTHMEYKHPLKAYIRRRVKAASQKNNFSSFWNTSLVSKAFKTLQLQSFENAECKFFLSSLQIEIKKLFSEKYNIFQLWYNFDAEMIEVEKRFMKSHASFCKLAMTSQWPSAVFVVKAKQRDSFAGKWKKLKCIGAKFWKIQKTKKFFLLIFHKK